MTTPLEDQLADALERATETYRQNLGYRQLFAENALAAYDAEKAAPAYTNPMDGATRESLMRCAANAMARAELAEDECANLQESIMKHASKDAKKQALLEAEISQRQNEINELKVENDQWRKRFDDAMELLRGSATNVRR